RFDGVARPSPNIRRQASVSAEHRRASHDEYSRRALLHRANSFRRFLSEDCRPESADRRLNDPSALRFPMRRDISYILPRIQSPPGRPCPGRAATPLHLVIHQYSKDESRLGSPVVPAQRRATVLLWNGSTAHSRRTASASGRRWLSYAWRLDTRPSRSIFQL